MPQPIAAVVDLAMLDRLSVSIHAESVPIHALSPVSDPLGELGSRYLIKYIRSDQAAHFSVLSGVTLFTGPHFLTPTPLTKEEAPAALNLPPLDDPVRALLLLPENATPSPSTSSKWYAQPWTPT